jgi:DNA-binding CsgD family transcriptional regulator
MTKQHTDYERSDQINGAILTATGVPQLNEALWEISDHLGADGAVFTSFARDDETRESYKFVVACPARWCMEYNQNAWYAADPCLLYALANNEPELIQNLTLRSRGQKNMMAAAKDAGFVSGVVIPAHSPSGRSRIGVMYIGSRDPDYFNEAKLRKHRMLLRSVSSEMLDWFVRDEKKALLPLGDLSKEELELLKMTHGGYKSTEIADNLSLTKSAIDQKLFRLAKRFGTGSRKTAAAIAFRCGLLT